MPSFFRVLFGLLVMLRLVIGCAPMALGQDSDFSLSEMPPLPQTEGFAGSFVGVSGNHLLVIGGANFPELKPWEGGTKVWYRSVLALPLRPEGAAPATAADPITQSRANWTTVGQIDAPLGYGVSATFGDDVLCVGGSAATSHSAEVLAIQFDGRQVSQRRLAMLPVPLANHFGARVGNELIIAGGQQSPDDTRAESAVWSLCPDDPNANWSQLPKFPGTGRILAVAASAGDCFWIIGGAALTEGPDGKPQRRYLRDAWKYCHRTGWMQLPDLPMPCVAAPSPAPDFGEGPVILGGDNGMQVGQDPSTHRGFSKQALRFSTGENRWVPAGLFSPATVTAATVAVGSDWFIPTGEIRPGVRSPAVWRLRVRKP
jgi:N-acetylneuraminate epimerase